MLRTDFFFQSLFYDISDEETFFFSKDWTDYLYANGKFDRCIIFWRCKTNRNHEPRKSSKGSRDSEYIFEIECEWIRSFFSDFPCDRRCCRSKEYIDFSKCLSKIITDKFAHSRSFFIVCVVKTRRKNV